MTVDVTMQIGTWRAVAWVRAMGILAPLLGRARAERWAIAGAWRLARWRVDHGRWNRFEGPR